MIFKTRRLPLSKVTLTAVLCSVIVALPAAIADPMAFATAEHSTSANTPQRFGLAQAIAQFRSRISQTQTALNLGQQSLSTQRTLSAPQPVGGTVGATPTVANNPANDTTTMSMGCCAGMMGEMGAPGSASTTMTSGLPGFPGASHLYHVGATSFFLEYSAAIKLTVNQLAALNAIKETSIANQASAQREIDQAEQELWILTSSDLPDSSAIETKVRAIEKLKSEQRIAFINSVGEAARMLSRDQRGILLGTIAPVTAPTPVRRDSVSAATPPTGASPTNSQTTMPAAINESMGNMSSGDTAKPKSIGAMGDM